MFLTICSWLQCMIQSLYLVLKSQYFVLCMIYYVGGAFLKMGLLRFFHFQHHFSLLLFSNSPFYFFFVCLVLVPLFHSACFRSLAVYPCFLWVVWIQLQLPFKILFLEVLYVVLIGVHYYGINKFWSRHVFLIFNFVFVLGYMHWS